MAVRIKDLREMTFFFQDGFSGTSAINEATIIATDTTFGVDTHVIFDERTLVPIGARFTTAGIATIRTVTATQNSQQWTLDLTTAVVVGGTFDITLNGETSSTVAFDVSASALQTLLEALSGIGVGQVTVSEASGPIHTITFAGTLANLDTNSLSVDGSSLTNADTEVVINTQDGTETWEITFTPAIATGSVPADDEAITWYPRRLEFEIETGDFEWTEGATPIVRKPRGVISGIRNGEDVEMSITSTFSFSWLRSESTVVEGAVDDKTPYEVLKRKGFAADWLPSSHGSPCDTYTIDLVIQDSPLCGSEQAEIFVFPQFAFTEINPVVSDGVVNLTGICAAIEPIITRTANTADAMGIIF